MTDKTIEDLQAENAELLEAVKEAAAGLIAKAKIDNGWTERKARRERLAAVLQAGFNGNQNCYFGYSTEYDSGRTETWLYNGWPTLDIALEQADRLIAKIDDGE